MQHLVCGIGWGIITAGIASLVVGAVMIFAAYDAIMRESDDVDASASEGEQ